MMKRNSRMDEVQFGPTRNAAGPTAHQRIMPTQHAGGGPTIQYTLNQNILKPGSADTINLANQSTSNIQYTSSFTNSTTLAGNLAKSGLQGQATTNQGQLHTIAANINTSNTIRHKTVTTPGAGAPTNLGISSGNVGVPTTMVSTQIQQQQQQQQTVQSAAGTPVAGGQSQFQRLKVEDALSYLDQVKYKFGNQPQVYNDFLDIMKEFKSQSIDTPGVIERVSNLFKGHPELISGFNTFLPPGYKIEVQANDQGYAFQVSYSVEGGATGQTIQSQSSPPQKMQILQGSAQIVHSMPTTATAVNLMTHAHQQPMQGGAIQQQSIQQQPQAQQQQSQQAQQAPQMAQQVASTISIPQNYSRDRTNSGNSVQGGNVSVQQPSGPPQHIAQQQQQQQQQQQPQQQQQQQQQPLSDVSNQTIGGLQRISQAHQQMSQQPDPANSTQNQPVEFNHAINYVNKIKNRFQSQPEKYKRFLEILHTYQKEQKTIKEGSNNIGGLVSGPGGMLSAQGKQLTENEVYTQVAKLFDNNDDLLREFGQFLPDATSHASTYHIGKSHVANDHSKKMSGVGGGVNISNQHPTLVSVGAKSAGYNSNSGIGGQNSLRDYSHHYNNDTAREKEPRHHMPKYHGSPAKRSPSAYNTIPLGHNISQVGPNRGDRAGDLPQPPPPKRYKPICRDVTMAEASKYGTLHDFAFFDKVRKALRSPDVYDNFLRCLTLFNQEIISKSELLNLVTPFLSKFPDLLRWFQDFLVPSVGGMGGAGSTGLSLGSNSGNMMGGPSEGIPLATAQRQERTQSEIVYEIDLTTCKRLGASYCALPKSSEIKKCSGRTQLCKEVLNDTWVSFPTYAEDSTFVTSRKTQYEEFIYRCEDERFELDVVIETNRATIHALEGVQKKLNRMPPDEVARFRLDDNLGGTSPTIHQRTLRRIYGDKTNEIINGLKKSPVVAVPVVLRRLKAKEEEWREAQKGFNKQWREQNEKYYLKSLDHQGINFKQNDTKALRSKNLFNEIETLYEERHEQNEDGNSVSEAVNGPHLILPYKDKTILDDAANLLIHHVKRQTSIQKQEKARIKHIMRQFVPDMFFAPRQQLSDDEREDADDKMDVDTNDGKVSPPSTRATTSKEKEDAAAAAASSSTTSSAAASTATTTPPTTSTAAASTDLSLKSEVKSGSAEQDPTASSVCNNNNKTTNLSKSDANSNDSNSSANIDKIKVEIKEENDKETAAAVASSASATVTPQIPVHAVSKYPEEAYTLFFANNSWYLFLRLHAILCGRLRNMYERAQILIEEEKQYRDNRRESTAIALRLKSKSEIQVEDYYSTFLDMLKNVLDGNMDANNYEDSLREMFGIHAYIAFTLDKVVSYAVRQLQHCVTERGALDCVEMFQLEQKKSGAGGLCKTAQKRIAAELAYQRKAEASLQDENCFKVFLYKIDCRVTIELLDTESEEQNSNSVANTQSWSNYVERFANPNATGTANQSADQNIEIKTESTDDDLSKSSMKHAFLRRNIRKTKQKILKEKHPALLGPSEAAVDPMTATNSTTTTTTTATSSSSSVTTVSTGSTTATGVTYNETVSMVTTTASSTTTTSPTTSTIASSATISVTASVDIENKGATTAANVNSMSLHRMPDADNLNRLEEALVNRRPVERVGAGLPQTLYYIDDQEQVKVNVNTFKLYYIQGKDIQFYKRNSLRRAYQTHPAMTKAKHKKFNSFVQKWLVKNASESQKLECNEWLMGHKSDLVSNKTILKQDNDLTKTPYMVYNRYRVEKATTNVSTSANSSAAITSS